MSDFAEYRFEEIPKRRSKPSVRAWRTVQALWEQDEDQFQVLAAPGIAGMLATRPLAIIVHPGDAYEDQDDEVKDLSREFMQGMGTELQGMFDTHDFAVIHRLSSAYSLLDSGDAVPASFRNAIEFTHDHGTVLYGDDIETIVQWLVSNLGATGRQVFLTGAWSDPEHGCVSAIGQGLMAAGAKDIGVSFWSPSEPGSLENAWRPTLPGSPDLDVSPSAR